MRGGLAGEAGIVGNVRGGLHRTAFQNHHQSDFLEYYELLHREISALLKLGTAVDIKTYPHC